MTPGRNRAAGKKTPSRSEEGTSKAAYIHLMLSDESDSESVNQQRGGSDAPPLTIDLNRLAQDQEDIRQYAESIKEFRIDEQFENFKRNDSTSPLYDQLCAYVGDAYVVKNQCIREI